MEFLDPKLQDYIDQHSREESDLLHRLYRETHLKVPLPQMLAGNLQGQTIRMISMLLKPRYILEIGTFTGYSGICLAEGLQDDGKLYSLELSREREEMIKRYWTEAGIMEHTELIFGDATKTLPTIDKKFDLVFIDADKLNYPTYYDMILPKLNIGGVLLGDNVLWSGKVIEEDAHDTDTENIRLFNKKIQDDPRVENVLLPIRDGLMVARKVSD